MSRDKALCDFDTAVVVFSPGLELIYVGNYVILTLDPHAQPLLLPLPFVRTEIYSSRRLDWSFGFSACAQYFAAAANPMNGGVEAARLCMFKVDVGNCCSERREIDALSAMANEGLAFSFHPRASMLLVCGWRDNEDDGDDPTMGLRFLDYTSAPMKTLVSVDRSRIDPSCRFPALSH